MTIQLLSLSTHTHLVVPYTINIRLHKSMLYCANVLISEQNDKNMPVFLIKIGKKV
jgi:hypothetical protein